MAAAVRPAQGTSFAVQLSPASPFTQTGTASAAGAPLLDPRTHEGALCWTRWNKSIDLFLVHLE